MTMKSSAKTLLVGVFLVLVAGPSSALAKSWCANPIWAHEWGVQVFGEAPLQPALLSFAHDEVKSDTSPLPTRELEVDNGVRALPVLSFFAPRAYGEIPLGLEIGFSEGEASLWFPQVDMKVTATQANSDSAREARASLLMARTERQANQDNPPLAADPTRQLIWEALSLSVEGSPSNESEQAWVKGMRAIEGALWVGKGSASERFVFYEGRTNEQPLLRLARGASWTNERPQYTLHNNSAWPVHDVLVVRRQDDQAWVFYAPSIAPGERAEFVFDEPLDPKSQAFAKATRGQLESALIDAKASKPPTEYNWDMDTCVMGRDPALPFESALDHRLYAAEVEVLLDAWSPAFFEQEGSRIIYREDIAYLDAMMPLSIYTDMRHFVELSRLGLVLWADASW